MKPLILLFFFFIFVQCAKGQHNSFNAKYDLNFDIRVNKTISWIADPDSHFFCAPDNTQEIKGKHPVCLIQAQKGIFPVHLSGKIVQNILMPEIKAGNLSVSMTCKSENLKFARLVITEIDESESNIFSDTLSLLGLSSFQWKTYNKVIQNQNAAFLNLSIEVEGKNDDSKQRMDLDKIEIKLDGKDLDRFPLREIAIIPNLIKNKIIPLSFKENNYYKKISELRDRKIIALGQTIHGSETITETACQLIKYQVENNHCRLIILEDPIECVLRFNRFIQGDKQFEIENFKKDLSFSASSPKIMIELLNWLKQYNEKSSEKVYLMGMDYSQYNNYASNWLYEFILKINQTKKNDILKLVCSNLIKYDLFPVALNILEENKELANILGKNDYETLTYCLKMYIYNTNNSRFNRDIQMFSNVSFLLNLLCSGNERAIIFAHFNHTNYLSNETSLPYSKSLGSFMKKKYNRNYYNIAIMTGEGSFMIRNKDSFLENKLEIPPINSLENMLMKTNMEICFLPIISIPHHLIYIRINGTYRQNDQYRIIAPASRMDAAIFVRKSTGFRINNY